ncbi:MAG: Maf family protein [Methylovirgula sp.]
MNSGMHGLWLGKTPLLLASKSASRRVLLSAARIPFDAVDAAIDERSVEGPLIEQGASPETIAAHLARTKAQAVAEKYPERLALGADQTLAFGGKIYSKPATLADAREQLIGFSGRSHALHSAICLAFNGKVLFEIVVTAHLTCRLYSAAFVDHYLAAAGESVLASVGAYQLEGLGIHLFDRVEGDHSTILGLPLLPLLDYLRRDGWLRA